jgi:hypothetical protein
MVYKEERGKVRKKEKKKLFKKGGRNEKVRS